MTLDRRQFLGAAAAGAVLTILGVGGADAGQLGAATFAQPRLLAPIACGIHQPSAFDQ